MTKTLKDEFENDSIFSDINRILNMLPIGCRYTNPTKKARISK